MGYNTEFTGELKFTQDILGRDVAYMQKILGADCREHPEWRGALKSLPFYDVETKYGGLTYMDFELTEDYDGIKWSGSEKSYDMVDKVNLLIALMRERVLDFGLEGVMAAQGEQFDDRWELFIDEDGWAKRRPLITVGDPITCPHCENRFVPGEDDPQYRY